MGVFGLMTSLSRRLPVLAAAATAVLAAGLVSGVVLDDISPEPPVLPDVTSVTFSGSGCPQGSTNVSIPTSSWADWTFSLHQFSPEDPDKATSAAGRTQNCQVHATLVTKSPGWQLAVRSASMRGFSSLSSGSSLAAFATIFWSQDPANVSLEF